MKIRKQKKPKAEKPAGRKPSMAPFVNTALEIRACFKTVHHRAKVDVEGIITYDGKDYTSPSAAAMAITKKPVDGWTFWKMTKDGQEVPIDALRGRKSPLEKAATTAAAA